MRTSLRLTLFLLVALSLFAQTIIVTPVTIAGDGLKHAVNANEQARWVTFIAPATNATTTCSSSPGGAQTGCPHVGDTNVSTSRGVALTPGASITFPVLPTGQPGYSLAQIFYTVATGDTLVVIWAK